MAQAKAKPVSLEPSRRTVRPKVVAAIAGPIRPGAPMPLLRPASTPMVAPSPAYPVRAASGVVAATGAVAVGPLAKVALLPARLRPVSKLGLLIF